MTTPALRKTNDPTLDAWMSQLPDETRQLALGPAPAEGARHEALMEVAYRAGESGLGNDAILELLDAVCLWWGKFPRTYDRWNRLLSILRRVRKQYPNSEQGEGYSATASANNG